MEREGGFGHWAKASLLFLVISVLDTEQQSYFTWNFSYEVDRMATYDALLFFNPSWTKARLYGGFTYPSWTKARLYGDLLIIRQTPDFLVTGQILGNWALNKSQPLWVIYWSLGKRQTSCSLIRNWHIGILPDFNRGAWTYFSDLLLLHIFVIR